MPRLLARHGPPLLLALAALGACGGGGGDPGSLPIAGGTGAIALNVTDAPVDGLVRAVVQFSGVALKRFGQDEQVFTFDPPLRIDLLALQGFESAPLLPSTLVNAGPYESLRLVVDADRDSLESYVVLPGGAQRPLYLPSGAESGLRVTRGFSVPPGGPVALTIDFDLRKSLGEPDSALGPFPLRPALRLVNNSSIGGIQGTAGVAALADASCPFPANPELNVNLVYVFDGFGTQPDDIDGGGVEPVTTGRLQRNSLGAWFYRIGFLPPGQYTVAFTCQGASEDPQRSDNLVFLGARNVLVVTDQVTSADFF
ncbi:DUF4382 domain-containing protein [Ramlibacter rhizophilus]|uniref:DUF4382 domain-containing protein n=1 Tax=Ramlibacter rhizophilus TaxID=1781167 RepID=A0A4Z0BF79_9BURK|nr:DUF4382 domain-containing protein [Ramlibacter rhizophilus]TFY97986.1 DUF4382 domain-containing protein [Ramlibacter rhizophilus]